VNELTLQKITAELSDKLKGRMFGKIFGLSKAKLAIDFRLPEYLFVSIEPNQPRIYFIRRKLKEIEQSTGNPTPFALLLRKKLANAQLQTIEKIKDERILRFAFLAQSELGEIEKYNLIFQLTGRSSNIFLLDENDFIIDSLKESETATKYEIPSSAQQVSDSQVAFEQGEFETLSEALDVYYQQLEADKLFNQQAKSAESKIKTEITKREKLIKKLRDDLHNHGDAEKWKRNGDLLLANLANAVRIEDTVLVVDYFDENIPTVEIEVDRNLELTFAAEKFFKRYTKARNAKLALTDRIVETEKQIGQFQTQLNELKSAIEARNLSAYASGKDEKSITQKSKKPVETYKGARSFVSSDGFEILVGKASKDNDYLTFRIAKSLDLWLHAADYGGSHVVIRNPNRVEIPNKTLLEAAQLAAFYSQAKEQPKVAVHYTHKKFVNKPKGAVPGLVSLSSFKTVLVEDFLEIKVKQK
jgi:predicted ribosome quality control (RQC) complex YloA/Tae2 family protein